MPADTLDEKLGGWKIPLSIAVAALVAAYALILYSPNFGDILSFFIVIPAAVIVLARLLIPGPWRIRRVRFAVLTAYLALSWLLFTFRIEVREQSRWLATSNTWKARVMAGSHSGRFALVPDTDPFKVVAWDGWGMYAQDTDVYLVYDPLDDLRHYRSTALHGLPCPVWKVQRLERNWYSVTFFTSTGWAHPCN